MLALFRQPVLAADVDCGGRYRLIFAFAILLKPCANTEKCIPQISSVDAHPTRVILFLIHESTYTIPGGDEGAICARCPRDSAISAAYLWRVVARIGRPASASSSRACLHNEGVAEVREE